MGTRSSQDETGCQIGLTELRRFSFSIEKEWLSVARETFDAESMFQVAAVAMVFLLLISP
jgi:hypothetical protein